MARAMINGANINYEILGRGTPVALTPGGRMDMEAVRSLAEALSSQYRVLIYDRQNCGASDVVIGGELSEQEIWADSLHALLNHLGMAPAYVGGGSAGCRVSLLLALRHLEDVKGLLLWWVTGGPVAAERLGYNYYGQFIEAAQSGGMEAVVKTDFFAERIQQNPGNRQRLLAMDPARFCEVMTRWRSFFHEGAHKPVIGATVEELQRIAIPTVIVPGNDEIHPREVGEGLHRLLPQSELALDLATAQELAAMQSGDFATFREERNRRLVPIFSDFLARAEATRVRPS